MRVHSLLSFIACGGASTLVVGQELKIPWVESMMASVTDKYADAVSYHGPTGTALAALKVAEASLSSSALARPTSVAKILPRAATPYWLEQITHQGISAFHTTPATYQVFRNVKSFGAKGDGITDDTAAIQLAISSGNRCGPANCESTTTTPAIVYFPAGTYKISKSIVDFYYTQIHGNPNDLPILKATADFVGFGIIDGDQYQPGGALGFGPTNTFYRQIRNIVFDITAIPASSEATGLHWPTAQATSLQNLVFKLSDAAGTQHRGIFIEGGSGGFMTDLVFYGGLSGVVFGNQQFTTRNLTFYNSVTAINQLWSWGWTYAGVNIFNCSIGLDISGGGSAAQSVGSVVILDSTITNTKVGIKTAWSTKSLPATAGSLVVENVQLNNVPVGIQGPSSVLLAGGTKLIAGYRQGHTYAPGAANPAEAGGTMLPFSRPATLLNSAKRYYTRSKPQYENLPLTSFLSARAAGAKGDGKTDDATVLNTLFATAAAQGKVVFIDAGTYRVTKTVFVPPGSKIVGESYPVIFGAGAFFINAVVPQPIVKVGNAGQTGVVEWSDTIVSTKGNLKGAILIQWNLDSSPATPSGMWDVHTRIGGFAGSLLLLADCPASRYINTPITAANQVDGDCLAAFMSLHLSKTSQGLYLENVWLWVADHDIEDPELRRLSIYAARGLYSESTKGNFWLWGTSSEHHVFSQYQFANTKNVFMGQIQTETAYFQPNPKASIPYAALTAWNDPAFKASCTGVSGNCEAGWGLRIINSTDLFVYGAGLYSFFDNYSTTCSDAGNGASCQTRIFSIEGSLSKRVGVYNLNTVGSQQMATIDGKSFAGYAPNQNVYPQTIAMFRNYVP